MHYTNTTNYIRVNPRKFELFCVVILLLLFASLWSILFLKESERRRSNESHYEELSRIQEAASFLFLKK